MKKKILIILILSTLIFEIFSQVSADPTHPFYTDVLSWETKGLITSPPSLRPYPLAVIKDILTQVINGNDAVHAAVANEYYEDIFGKTIYTGVEFRDFAKVDGKNDLNEVNIEAKVVGDLQLFPLLSLGLDMSIFATDSKDIRTPVVLPTFSGTIYDAPPDPAKIGSFESFLNMNNTAAFGNSNYYIQGGLSRVNFGSYLSGSVLSPNAYHNANLSYVLTGEKWRYTHSQFVIGATNNLGYSLTPNKYMAFHAIEFNPIKWCTFTYYENMIYGKRFDLTYLLPFVPFMVAQGIGGFEDNLQMGVGIKIKPIDGVMWLGDFFVDDFSVNDLAKLKFNTRIKSTIQTGFLFTPSAPFVKLVSLDYLMIVPYMYTHSQYDETNKLVRGNGINYQNYTNNGQSMGTALPPNSDRVAFSLLVRPVRNLNIGFSTSMIRHANINESISVEDAKRYLNAATDDFLTDGSVFNYPDAGDGYLKYALDNFMFMEQPTKMYIWQTGLDVAYTLPWKKYGTVSLNAGYMFEYIKNYGVNANMFPGGKTGATDDNVTSAKNAWKAQLKDVVNNYFRVSVKYLYGL